MKLLFHSGGGAAPVDKKQATLLAGLGLAGLCGYGLLHRIGHWGVHFNAYLLVFASLFLLYLAAAFIVRTITSPVCLFLTVALAAGFYLVLAGTKPFLSDDIYRYMWDGKMQEYGFNPYATPPNAPELTGLRDGVYDSLRGEPRTAIYPPLAELLFRLFAGIGYSATGFKVLLFPFFLGCIWFLVRILNLKGMNPNLVLLFAWNPLVIIETAGMGHLDIVGVCLLLGALVHMRGGRPALSALFLGSAAMVKFLPGIFLPFFWQRAGKKKLPFMLIFTGSIIALYLPYTGAGGGLFRSLGRYAAKWVFNGFIYRMLMPVVYWRTLYLVLAGLVLLALMVRSYNKKPDLENILFTLLAFILLVSPALFPWYLVWLVPFCLFNRSLPFILLTGLATLSYSILAAYVTIGIWAENTGVFAFEYAVFAAIFFFYYRKEISGRLAAAGRWVKKGRAGFFLKG